MAAKRTKDAIRDMTVEQKLTPRDIAKLLDLSTQAVYKHLKSLGLEPVRKAS